MSHTKSGVCAMATFFLPLGKSLDVIDKTASHYLRKVGVVLSGTASHVIMSGARKAPRTKGRGKDVN